MQVGDEGVLLVDTGAAGQAERVLAAIRQLSDKPIRFILNTHAHPDHIGGNERLARAGGRPTGGAGSTAPGPAR